MVTDSQLFWNFLEPQHWAANLWSIQVLDARLPGTLNMRVITSLRLFNRLVAKKNNPTLKCSCHCKFQVQLVLEAFK